jgi:leader peptidase (prepilin peptidase)/N-methyltransferase
MIETETEDFNLSWPGSHCPQCHTPLRWFHNIPLLSFIGLRGHCHACKKPISWQYPLIELSSALISVSCALHWQIGSPSILWALLGIGLLTLSVIDWRTTLLPDLLTLGLMWLGLMGAALGWLYVSPAQSILGAATGYSSLWLIAWIYALLTHREGMGAGDFKLVAALGAWLGVSLLPLLVLFSTVLALAIALIRIALGRMKSTDYLPLGPFLSIAAVVLAWFGESNLQNWIRLVFSL